MRLTKRSTFAFVFAAVMVVLLSGCIPIPPQPPSGDPLACKTGEARTFETTQARQTFQTKVCWDSNNNIRATLVVGQTCTALNGYTTYAQSNKASWRGGILATCQVRMGNNYPIILDDQWWTKSGVTGIVQHSCASPNNSSCGPWQRGFDMNYPDQPPPPPPAPRRVQGTFQPASVNAQLTVDGRAISTSGGSFNYTLASDYPNQHTLKVTPPPGYSVAYTACSNKTDCHSGRTPTPGDTVTANPDPGKFLDVRWYFTQTGTVQGFKMVDHIGASVDLPAVQALWVEVDGQRVSSGPVNPYVVGNLTAGNHLVQVEVPDGWYVGYTLCYNDISCHNGPVQEWTDRVNVDVPAGGFADLYWHYYQL